MRPSSSFSGSEPGRVSQTIAEGTGGERVCLLNLRCGFPWEGKELSGIEGQISAVGPGRTLSAAPKLIRSSLSLDNYGESPRDGEREGERESAFGYRKVTARFRGSQALSSPETNGVWSPGWWWDDRPDSEMQSWGWRVGRGDVHKGTRRKEAKGTDSLKDHLREMQEGGDLGICVYV